MDQVKKVKKSKSRQRSRSRPKKPPKTDKAKKALEMRDSMIEEGYNSEDVNMLCKGMFRCDKDDDEKCLDGILKKLQDYKKKNKPENKVGGGVKRRSRSKSPKRKTRSKSRSRSKKR